MADTTQKTDFYVARTDLEKCSVAEAAVPDMLEEGQALLKVERFAFTANNITYAAFGEAMRYWEFFPAPEGQGQIPVWGFAEVVTSRAEGAAPGERVYGYLPMSTHLVVEPVKADAAGFFDGAAHRRELPVIYNHYVRCATDPGYAAKTEELQMLFRPLFMTSWLINDFLEDNDFFDGKAVILSSASSKTAFGLAFLLKAGTGARVIGLTSGGNVEFVEGLGCYDQVLAYDDIATLDASEPVVFVDFAGSGPLRSALHHFFADKLKYSCSVGASHWDQPRGGEALPGAKPTLFFAPSQAQKRAKEWGTAGLMARFAADWAAFLGPVSSWISVIEGRGPAAVEEVYKATLAGDVPPHEGHILSLWD